MKFEFSDAWLLEAIKLSERGDEGATLTDIIRAADYINHSIMTKSEFVNSASRLKGIGLIIEKNKRFRTTDKFNEWWTQKYGQKGRFSILKAMEEIGKYLNKNFGAIEEPTKGITTEITNSDLDMATAEYQKLAEEAFGKLTRKKGER